MIYCLHGFLGSPHDWDPFDAPFIDDAPLIKADLFGADAFPEASSLPAWVDAYAAHVVADERAPSKSPRHLVGYSLGGRLALHLAVRFPALWDSVTIIGANPGLDSEAARAPRLVNDEKWARRFETEPWDTVLAAWDAQPVFAGRQPPLRREQDFRRTRLADALRRWSLGNQLPLWDALGVISCPLLWIAGGDDPGQQSICQRLANTLPNVEIAVVPGAGHRVPWEQPQMFAARMAAFLTKSQSNRKKDT